MKTLSPLESPILRSTGRLHIPVLAALAALVALWAPVYLALVDYFDDGMLARPEVLEWSLFVIGAAGLGSVVYLAWRDIRDPAWRAAHGLPRRPQSNTAAH